MSTSTIHKYIFLIFGIIASFLFVADVHAAVIIQRPLYIGLTNGLVGFWSFDGPDMACPVRNSTS